MTLRTKTFKSRFLTQKQLAKLAGELKISLEELTARGGYVPHTDSKGVAVLKDGEQLFARTIGTTVELEDPTDKMEVTFDGQPASQNVLKWLRGFVGLGINNYVYDNFVSLFQPLGDHSLEKLALDALSTSDSSGALFSKESLKLAVSWCGNYFAAKFAPHDKRAYFEAAARGKFTLEILVRTFGQAINTPEMLAKFVTYISEFGEAAAQGFIANGEPQVTEEEAETIADIALMWVENIQKGMESTAIADPLDGLL